MTPPNLHPAPIPSSFTDYLRSFGPGLIVVLTWLGAGDIVDMGVAGGNYGYALMWVLIVAVLMRYLFVSLIAKYQLCNQFGEGVLDGLVRLHRAYGPLLLVAALIIGHVNGAYMSVGIGEACKNVTQLGAAWQWALGWNLAGLALILISAYPRMEFLFKFLTAVLSISLVGTAIWVQPDLSGVARGLLSMKMPEQVGEFAPLLVAMAMIGAVGGSLMNLVYPYFLENKGWKGPQYRRVQRYDFLLAIVVMIVLNLSVWILGAELLYPHRLTINSMDDLPWLLSMVLGPAGRLLFYAGIFAAIYTSLIGHALGLACLGSHAYQRTIERSPGPPAYRGTRLYYGIIVWCMLSPLVWTLPGMPDFVTLTLVVNGAQVLLLPMIAGGLWWITASPRFIGVEYCNRWWENLVMALLFALAIWGAVGSVQSLVGVHRQPGASREPLAELAIALERLGGDAERDGDGVPFAVDLSGTPVTDRDLSLFADLSELQTLRLAQTAISDVGLYHLKSLAALRSLDLRGTLVTARGVATLQQSLPRCQILVGEDAATR